MNVDDEEEFKSYLQLRIKKDPMVKKLRKNTAASGWLSSIGCLSTYRKFQKCCQARLTPFASVPAYIISAHPSKVAS